LVMKLERQLTNVTIAIIANRRIANVLDRVFIRPLV